MRFLNRLWPALIAISLISVAQTWAARAPANRVLLSNVKTLTLRKDLETSHRRVSPLPQLKCVGGNGRGLYEVDVMRCKNQGSDYDEHSVQWTCSASLPPEFKLGTTDVICEGYNSPDDPYILKGSCGVEYRLVLSTKGEEKYGRGSDLWKDFKRRGHIDWVAFAFWACFIGVVGWIIYSAFFQGIGGRAPRGGWGGPGGGSGGGGGGGGGGGADNPPPPYDAPSTYAPRKPQATPTGRNTAVREGQNWRPGFWTGLLGGSAATYLATNRGRNRDVPPRSWDGRGWQDPGGLWRDNGGEGSSTAGRPPGSGGSSSTSPSSSRYESTGFGSTRRR